MLLLVRTNSHARLPLYLSERLFLPLTYLTEADLGYREVGAVPKQKRAPLQGLG